MTAMKQKVINTDRMQRLRLLPYRPVGRNLAPGFMPI